jgi:hypothetical protein
MRTVVSGAILALAISASYVLPTRAQLADNVGYDGKTVHVVSAVVRYYASEGGWRTLESMGENHPTINVSSVESDNKSIIIHYDTKGWGRVSPSTVLANPDETLALDGVFVGASGGRDKAVLQLGKVGPDGVERMDPNAFADRYGNIWFYAVMVEIAATP